MKTTVIGSYPKVWEGKDGTKLIGAISKYQKGVISNDRLNDIFDEVTRHTIEEQEKIGIDIITDGQIRWEDIVTHLAKDISGFKINGLNRFFDNNVYYRRPVVTKRLSKSKDLIVDEARFAKSCVKKSKLKSVLCGPYTFSRLSENRCYRSENKLILDIARLLNEEVKRLESIGIEYIQIDEPSLAYEPPDDIRCIIEAINIVFDGCLSAKKALYIYFGSVSNRVLSKLLRCDIDILGLDALCDNVDIIKLIKGSDFTKELGFGCVDARNTKIENPDALKLLFDRVSRVISPDRVYVGPNCGLEFLPHDRAVAKLNNMVRAVKEWRKL